jgi:hypothetical protein
MSDVQQNQDWLIEQWNREARRLDAIIRNPQATEEEIRVAETMLDFVRKEHLR